ncbi:bifunctional diguanylate cyclase/phosphodiesterase [Marinobacterium jannaschii]|uniref:bifunctional diguanylate cyclase/phosphodiesterase n=1 Tax=Marinobacterium jannaschii TaxID=64970 RepID=UPI001470BC74|nr:EAL domain-containing protein [Marinobacterium jannaschii]
MLVLILLVVHGSYSFIAYYQLEQRFEQERERINQRDLAVLEGMISSSYQRLLEVGEMLPLIVENQAGHDVDELLLMSQELNLNFNRFTLNGSLDALYLYNERAQLVGAWGKPIGLPLSVVRNVLRTEKPVRSLECSYDCLRYVALPLRLSAQRTGVLVVGRALVDIILAFNQQNSRDVGLALRVDGQSSELPDWGLNLKFLTHKVASLEVLQGAVLSSGLPLEGGRFSVDSQGRHYEVLLRPPAALPGEKVYWVLMEDLTQKQSELRRELFSSLALAAAGLFVAAVLQLSALRKPFVQLSHIARHLPLLADSSYDKVKEALDVKRKPLLGFHDELDVLRDSSLELTDQLRGLELSVLERTQSALQRSEELERERDFVTSLLDTAQAVILTLDYNGYITSINSFGLRALGVEEEILNKVRFQDLNHDEQHLQEHFQQLDRLSKGLELQVQFEGRLESSDGFQRDLTWLHSRLNHPGGDGSRILTIGMDITERKSAERRLFWLVNHDPLTSLPNRMLFNEHLSEQLRKVRVAERDIVILACDLDGFKAVNEALGYVLGDDLLRQAAQRILTTMPAGTMVARMGSDEFMVTLNLPRGSALTETCPAALLQAFQKPFLLDGYEIFVTLSIGIARYPEHGEDATTLVKSADMAIFQAKDDGRNRVRFFNSSLGVERDERFSLVNDLHKAIENKQLLLHYQPQINAITGKVVGLEALLRWNHPVAGMIPPGKFIPVAEEQGLIVPIGDWVLEQACLQLQRWQADGVCDVQVGVNLAGQQLMHEGILGSVERSLQKAGLDATALDLEVTESFLLRHTESTISKLYQLREMGVTLSMDDFGTGYSSLSYLKKLPMDRLKIDQSFVRDIGRDADDESIVRAIIALCQSLGLEVLAEGVETAEQLAFLRMQGCHLIQGYYYSKPLEAEEVLPYLLEKNAVAESV